MFRPFSKLAVVLAMVCASSVPAYAATNPNDAIKTIVAGNGGNAKAVIAVGPGNEAAVELRTNGGPGIVIGSQSTAPFYVNDPSTGKAALSLDTTGQVTVGEANRYVKPGGFLRQNQTTVVGITTLDPTPVAGDQITVIDARDCTTGAALLGGGTISCPVMYLGGLWSPMVFTQRFTETFALATANVASASVTLFGGDYIFAQTCSAYGTDAFQVLGPDGTTWSNLASYTTTDSGNGHTATLGANAVVRVTLTGTTGCNVTLSRIP